MNSDPPGKCVGCPYRGRHIYIVGSQRFERELMINFISTHTGAQWFEAERLDDIPVTNHGVPYDQKMILFDTHTRSRDDLVDLFSSTAWKIQAHNLLALFNVPHEYEIEKIAMKNGVRGLLYYNDHIDDLLSGICAINSGEYWISRRILSECLQESYIDQELSEPVSHSLSVREIELLRVLATGASNDAIADRMCISTHTVKTHMHNIFPKIAVDNRIQAALWAKENL